MAVKRTPVVAVKNNGRTTTAERGLSKATLEFVDWLVDGVTLSVQAPDFEVQAKRIATAKREITGALKAKGGVPIAEKREQQG